jgi:L-galactose dehydrogenase
MDINSGKDSVEKHRLGQTDLSVSQIGFGASPLGDVYGRIDVAESNRAVHLAIERGINFFDVSPYYGLRLAEKRLGDALVGKRQEIILATKVGRYGLNEFDFSARRTIESVEESLKRLKTDYIDLLQVHDVEFGDFDQIVEETLPALRKIQQSGKARFIGITGYPPNMLVRIAKAFPVDTILNYCHYNLLTSSMEEELTPFAIANSIGLINASALHMGVLTKRGALPWHPAPPEVHKAGRIIGELCHLNGKDISATAIRFCLDHPHVSSTLVGMATQEEVTANLGLLKVKTDDHFVAALRAAIAPAFNIYWSSGSSQNGR